VFVGYHFLFAAADAEQWVLLGIAGTGVLRSVAQGLAWSLRLPAILLLLAAGIVVGPVWEALIGTTGRHGDGVSLSNQRFVPNRRCSSFRTHRAATLLEPRPKPTSRSNSRGDCCSIPPPAFKISIPGLRGARQSSERC
jgi:hypothetical protein